MTLKDLRPGQSAVVKKLTGEGAVKRRIMDMGLTKGAELFVRKVAPLGDPLEITVRGYELSVRSRREGVGGRNGYYNSTCRQSECRKNNII